MELRKYNNSNCKEIGQLLYETVHTVNAKDYTQKQLNVWIPSNMDYLELGKTHLLQPNIIVAVEDKKIIGFGSTNLTGEYIGYLYVQKDSICKGVGTAICNELEKYCKGNDIMTYSSITAKSFFEKRGYMVASTHKVSRNGIEMKNYLMVKIKENIKSNNINFKKNNPVWKIKKKSLRQPLTQKSLRVR